MFYTHLVYIPGYRSSSRTAKASMFMRLATSCGLEFVGVDYDADTMSFDAILAEVKAAAPEGNVIYCGTSLGGFFAAMAASGSDVAVAMNPSVSPKYSLTRYSTCPKEVTETYPEQLWTEIAGKKKEILFYFSDDEFLDSIDHADIAEAYIDKFGENWASVYLEGGSHRFDDEDHLTVVFDTIRELSLECRSQDENI